MNDDYLWDGASTPDERAPDDRDVRRLEAMLGPLRTPLPPAPLDRLTTTAGAANTLLARSPSRTYRGVRFLAPMFAAAAAVVLMIASTWRADAGPSWEVARMDGLPHVESTPLSGTGRIAVGQTLVTDATSRARMDVSTIGQVTVDHDTRVRLVDTREGRHQLALERGTLHAFITAPPGQFVVNTPSSTATDLGCVYTLTVDEDGTGMLSVTAGWVAFEFKGRESFVPARASSRTDPVFGPGTPRYDDADQEFREALDRFDQSRRPEARTAALVEIIERARTKDAMTLWHLVARVDASDRPALVDALEARAPMPSGVTRDATLALDRAALDLWWDSLGLRDATWWRKWKGPYPG